jgi:hypothetical protein
VQIQSLQTGCFSLGFQRPRELICFIVGRLPRSVVPARVEAVFEDTFADAVRVVILTQRLEPREPLAPHRANRSVLAELELVAAFMHLIIKLLRQITVGNGCINIGADDVVKCRLSRFLG